MRTCPAPGCGTSRSTISKSPPGLGTCTAFIGANATLVVAMLPSGWNVDVPRLDAARLPPGTAYLGATYRLTRFRIRRLRGWPTGLLVRGAREVGDDHRAVVLGGAFFGIDGGEGAEEQIGGVGHDGSAARGDLVPGLEFIEFAEGVVDVSGGAEFLDVTDEGGGEVSLVEVLLALSGVFVAEARVRIRDGHATTTAAGGAILTMERGGVGVGDGSSSLRIHARSFPAGAGMVHFGNCWDPPPLFS